MSTLGIHNTNEVNEESQNTKHKLADALQEEATLRKHAYSKA